MKQCFLPLILIQLLSFINVSGQSFEYGYIKEGLIEIVVEDSTEENLALKGMMADMMKHQFDKEVYFSPNLQVEVEKRPGSELRSYYTDKRGVFHRVLMKGDESVYSIDSSQVDFYKDERINKILDSIALKLDKDEAMAPKAKHLDMECSELTLEAPGGEGSLTMYLNRSLQAKVYGIEVTASMPGYPIKIKLEVAPGLYVIHGATEIKAIKSKDSIFNFDLSNMQQISNKEMIQKTGLGMGF